MWVRVRVGREMCVGGQGSESKPSVSRRHGLDNLPTLWVDPPPPLRLVLGDRLKHLRGSYRVEGRMLHLVAKGVE